jgi:hypothetical protein
MIITLYKQDSSGDIRRWQVQVLTESGTITTNVL